MAALTQNPGYISGDWSTPVRISQTPKRYPFRALGDVTTYEYDVIYRVTLAKFSPSATVSTDPENASAYLLEETLPVPVWQGARGIIAEFRRTYSTIPTTQTLYGSQAITKPNPSTLGTAENFSASYVSSDTSSASLGTPYVYDGYTWLNNQVYYRKSGTPTVAVATSGTFTVTYKGNTTAALGYNAADATIAAAINGLASVIADGITCTATNALGTASQAWVILDCTVGAWLARCTFNAGSLGPAAAQTGFAFSQTSTRQYLLIGWRVPITSHAFSASANLLFSYTAAGPLVYEILIAPTIHWKVIDANTIAIGPLFVIAGTAPDKYGTLVRAYTPGTDRVGIKQVQSFYLPTVTGGITTGADIPIPAPLLNDADFLASVLANLTGYQTYDSSPLTQYKNSPIYTQTAIQINMADV